MKIPMEDWLRGCVYHYGRNGQIMLPTDKIIEIADYIQDIKASVAGGMIEFPESERKEQ